MKIGIENDSNKNQISFILKFLTDIHSSHSYIASLIIHLVAESAKKKRIQANKDLLSILLDSNKCLGSARVLFISSL